MKHLMLAVAVAVAACVSACEIPLESVPPKAPKTDNLAHVNWIEVRSEPELWQIVYSNPRVVVMFDAQLEELHYESCRQVEKWWREHKAPEDWIFVAWIAHTTQSPMNSVALELLDKAQYKSLTYSTGRMIRFPMVTVIENAHPDTPIYSRALFSGFTPTTQELLDWLLQHSHRN